MTPAIETMDLTRRFGPRTAVDGVSMVVPRRCIYGFLGRNGAGKTTTIKLLLGLLRASVISLQPSKCACIKGSYVQRPCLMCGVAEGKPLRVRRVANVSK